MSRKLLSLSLILLGTICLSASGQDQHTFARPNIEAAQRTLQERYMKWYSAASAMRTGGVDQMNPHLTFPKSLSEGKDPGLFPVDCFYENDLVNKESGQPNMDRLYYLIQDLFDKMTGNIEYWGRFWLHPDWHGNVAGNDAILNLDMDMVKVVDSIEDTYPNGLTVDSSNFEEVFKLATGILNQMTVMTFTFGGDTANDTITEKVGPAGDADRDCAIAKSLAKAEHDSLTPTTVQPVSGYWEDIGRRQHLWSFVGQGNKDYYQGEMVSYYGRLWIDYSDLEDSGGDVDIYAFLSPLVKNSEEDWRDTSALSAEFSAGKVPYGEYDKWFSIDTFAVSPGGIYTSDYYGSHNETEFRVDCPASEQSKRFAWTIIAEAVFSPTWDYFPPYDEITCSSCGTVCTEDHGGICSDLKFQSLSYTMGLGVGPDGSIGTLRAYSQTTSPDLASPLSLKLDLRDTTATVLKDANGKLRQILTEQILVDISETVPASEYIIRYYESDDKGTLSDGFYQPNPTNAIKSVTVTNPSPTTQVGPSTSISSYGGFHINNHGFPGSESTGLQPFWATINNGGGLIHCLMNDFILEEGVAYEFAAFDSDNICVVYRDPQTDELSVDLLGFLQEIHSVTLNVQNYDHLDIEETVGTRTRSIEYYSSTDDVAANHTITLTDTQGSKVRNYSSIKTYDTQDPSLFTEVVTETDGSLNVIRKTQTNFKAFSWNVPSSSIRSLQAEVVSIVEDPDGEALTTSFSYYTDPLDTLNFGRTKSIQYQDGQWVAYEYGSGGAIAKTYRPYKDSSLSEPFSESGNDVKIRTEEVVTDDDSDGIDESAHMTVRKINAVEVSRSYLVNWTDTSSGYVHQASIEAAVPGAAWNATGNLRTDYWYFFSGENSGEMAKVKNPDGTMRIYAYSVDSVSGEKTTTIKEGEPNAAGDDIVDGLETETVVSSLGGQVSRTVTDFASGIVLSQETTVTFDDLGRPTLISYMDGTSESFLYEDCCGDVTVTDRTGLATTTNKEMDGTVASVVTNGITTSYSEGYDSDSSDGITGFTKTTTVEGRGTAGSIITRIDTYSPSGELVASIDPRDSVSRTTGFSEAINGFGRLEKSTTLPNTAVQKNVYHKDGTLYQEYFNGVLIREYDYAVVSDTHDGANFYAKTELVTKLGPNGETTEWVKTYTDMLGRVYKVETPDMDGLGTNGLALTYYNSKGQRSKQVDPDGLNTLFKYNDKGELEEVALSDDDAIDYSGTDRITQTTRSVLDDPTNGEVIRETVSVWEDGQSTGTVIQTTDTSTDRLDVWTARYGQLTHLSRTYNGSGSVTDIEARPDSTTATTTTLNGFRTGYTFSHPTEGTLVDFSYVPDDFDRLYTETNDLLSATTTYTYWDSGALKQVVTPESATGAGDAQTTTYDYNVMGQVTEVTLPGNKVQSSRYHPDGNLKLTFGQGTYPVEYTYDRQGRMKTMKTWQDFDTATETGVSGSALTTWNYNDLGLVEKKLDNDSKGAVYTYTDAGRLASREWARIGQDGTNPVKTAYLYGTTGSTFADLLNIDYQNDNGVTKDVTYTYDRLGRIMEVFDASGKRTLSYEDGVLTDETYSDDGDPGTNDPFIGMVIDRRQDSHNRLDQVRVLDSQSAQLYKAEYGYDDASRLETVISGTNSVTYSYNPVTTTRQTLTYHNGTGYVMTVNQSFDKMDRQISQSSAITGGGTHSYTYAYNDLNQRTRMTLASGEYWQYGYDSLGQVNSAVKKTATDSVLPGYSYGFTFDHIGNRTDATINGRTDSYTPNLLNQYTSRNISRAIDVRGSALSSATVTIDGQATTRTGDHYYREIDLSGETSPNDARTVDYLVTATLPDGGYNNSPRVADAQGEEFLKAHPETFSHDDDGNLLYDGKWDYTWNAENRLIQAITKASAVSAGAPNLKLEFAYDSQGRRFQKDVFEDEGSGYELKETTYFLYDGWNLVAELDTDLDLQNAYVWGTDISGSFQGAGGVGGLLFSSNRWTGVTASPWYDGNGNVMGYVDVADNSIVAEFEYGAFGEPIRSTGPMVELLSFGYSTKYLDTETGLFYYGYRYYSREWGRWLSEDPIEESGGFNLYGFVDNDGISYVDDLGCRKREVHKVPPENQRIPVKPAPNHLQPKVPNVPGGRASGAAETVGDWVKEGFSRMSWAAMVHLGKYKCARQAKENPRLAGCDACCIIRIASQPGELLGVGDTKTYALDFASLVPETCNMVRFKESRARETKLNNSNSNFNFFESLGAWWYNVPDVQFDTRYYDFKNGKPK